MTTELLAPAGGREALVAAVQSGADAVYMGFGAFNARRSARNFSDEDFRAAVSYCHLRGVKVYLTLNTLVTDRELPLLADAARVASECGVDAILVQDWGVLDTLRSLIPDVPLHASTQMSLHTLSGVKESARLGMTRAVLARELSRGEISEICANSPIEIEAFVHGALCMCYSGQCEMSAVIGRRSGNRGACAQPCRLPYGFSGKANAHPLSLKDACLAPFVPEMQDMGVACLKIEGRMKRPEYVAAVTEIYARLLREHRAPTKDEQKRLALAFSRDGFTEGYYRGARGREMFGTRPENARWPEDWFGELRARYEKEDLRLVPLTFDCTIRAGEPMRLRAEDADGHTLTVTGNVPEAARNRALTAEEVEARLKKTGGTAFTVDLCAVTLDNGLAVSAGALNALRREALSQMEALRTAAPERRAFGFVPPTTVKNSAEKPLLTVSLHRAAQLSEELIALSPARVYLPVELLPQLDLAPYRGRTDFFALLPRIYRTQDEPILRALLEDGVRKGVTGVSIANLGHLSLVRGLDAALHGDWALNVYNSAALAFWKKEGLSSACASFELRDAQLRDLSKCLPCEAIVYGRLPLMVTENCLNANESGCRYFQERPVSVPADGACASAPELTDRRGEHFPVLRAWGCRSEIENGKFLYLADKARDWQSLGLRYACLRFTTESPEDCVRMLRAYRGEAVDAPENITRGLFYRGAE
ncbi:MAG: DUF3656 domain-containing protein [Oscillospiraceae bacterium]|mgnify:FL=1